MKVLLGHRNAPAFAVAALVTVLGALVSVGAAVAPPAPTRLTAFVTGTTVTLDWKAGANTRTNVSYRVEIGSSSGASNVLVRTTADRYMTINNIASGRYYVRVKAAYSGMLSAASNESRQANAPLSGVNTCPAARCRRVGNCSDWRK